MPEITHGELIRVSPRVRRITATNASRMTGPGTNSYVIGEREVALIDPGPVEQAHIDAIVDLVGERLRWILVTHTHRDHSPAAKPIADRTGAELVGNVIDNDGFQDDTFVNARALAQASSSGVETDHPRSPTTVSVTSSYMTEATAATMDSTLASGPKATTASAMLSAWSSVTGTKASADIRC